MNERAQRAARTLSTGLVAYGVVGLVLAVVLLGVSLTIGSRLEGLSGRLSDRLDTISRTVDTTATTLDRRRIDLRQLLDDDRPGGHDDGAGNTTLGEVVATVHELQSTAATLTIFGQTPLTSLADRFGGSPDRSRRCRPRSATSVRTWDNRFEPDLAPGKHGGPRHPASSRSASPHLRARSRTASARSCRSCVWTLGLLAIWFAVPAIAALVAGIWLRRQLAADAVTPAARPG